MTTTIRPNPHSHRLYAHSCGHPLWLSVAYIGGQGYVHPDYYSQLPITGIVTSTCPGCGADLPSDLNDHADAVLTGTLAHKED